MVYFSTKTFRNISIFVVVLCGYLAINQCHNSTTNIRLGKDNKPQYSPDSGWSVSLCFVVDHAAAVDTAISTLPNQLDDTRVYKHSIKKVTNPVDDVLDDKTCDNGETPADDDYREKRSDKCNSEPGDIETPQTPQHKITKIQEYHMMANLKKIVDHNSANHSMFKMGTNKFIVVGDFFKMYKRKNCVEHENNSWCGKKASTDDMNQYPCRTSKIHSHRLLGRDTLPVYLPTTLDYRKHSIITTPKEQGDCGSCWAFAIAAALESKYALETGKLISLSAQHVLDCAPPENSCKGGYYDSAMSMFENNRWLFKESEYPYEERKNKCRTKDIGVGLVYGGYGHVEAGDEVGLARALVRYGPIPISIHITEKFVFYSEGVFDDDICNVGDVNHAMLLIGFDENSWILKNSWGDRWGDNGFVRIKRGGNFCGITNNAIIPIFNWDG